MAYKPAVLTVADGGTGRATLTNHGVLVGAATTAITQLAAGSAGQVLQSGGASADPAYSTATYPATAGTSGNVLTSDGTNWTSAAPTVSGPITVNKTLTNAQVKALHGTPVQLVAAPGSGKIIIPMTYAIGKLTYGGTNVFTAGSAQTIDIYWGTTTKIVTALSNGSLVGSASIFDISAASVYMGGGIVGATYTTYENLVVNLYNPVAIEISGNAANNNTVSVSFTYYVATI